MALAGSVAEDQGSTCLAPSSRQVGTGMSSVGAVMVDAQPGVAAPDSDAIGHGERLPGETGPATSAHSWREGRWWPVVACAVGYAALSMIAFGHVDDMGSTYVSGPGGADQTIQVWWIAFAAHALAHGLNPFFSNWINYPVGLNAGPDNSMLLLGTLISPITALANRSRRPPALPAPSPRALDVATPVLLGRPRCMPRSGVALPPTALSRGREAPKCWGRREGAALSQPAPLPKKATSNPWPWLRDAAESWKNFRSPTSVVPASHVTANQSPQTDAQEHQHGQGENEPRRCSLTDEMHTWSALSAGLLDRTSRGPMVSATVPDQWRCQWSSPKK